MRHRHTLNLYMCWYGARNLMARRFAMFSHRHRVPCSGVSKPCLLYPPCIIATLQHFYWKPYFVYNLLLYIYMYMSSVTFNNTQHNTKLFIYFPLKDINTSPTLTSFPTTFKITIKLWIICLHIFNYFV